MEGRKEYLGTCWTRAKGSNFVGRIVSELSVNKDRGAPGVLIKDFSFVFFSFILEGLLKTHKLFGLPPEEESQMNPDTVYLPSPPSAPCL